MGNELSEGCFRSKTLGKGRIPLYDVGRVTPNNTQAKIHKYGQNFSSRDQEDKRKFCTSSGKNNEPILHLHKKSCQRTQLNLKSKTGRPLAKSDILNNEQALDQLKIQKKKVYSYETKSQTTSFQGNNSASTNDSRRQNRIDRIRVKKQDSLNTSEISLSQFNLPLETIVREKEESQQIQKIVKTNEKHKDGLNSKDNDRKTYRSQEIMDKTKYNSVKNLRAIHQKTTTQVFYEGKHERATETFNQKDRNQNKRNRRQTCSKNKSESSNLDKKKKTWTHSQHANNFNSYGL